MKIRNHFCAYLLGFALSFVSLLAWAQTPSLCENRGYFVAFFNGIWSWQDKIVSDLEAIRTTNGCVSPHGEHCKYKDQQPIQYEVFYNHSGLVDLDPIGDIVETFEQKANESNSPELATGIELLWEIISDVKLTLWNQLTTTGSLDAVTIEAALTKDFIELSAKAFDSQLRNPQTQADYLEHQNRLDDLAQQGQKLLFVAHSQGNLFANNAFNYISPKVDVGSVKSVKVVHIAPASVQLHGDYVLADDDCAIYDFLGLFPEVGGVQLPNLWLRTSIGSVKVICPLFTEELVTSIFTGVDPTGHGLTGTYLSAQPSLTLAGTADNASDSCNTRMTPGSTVACLMGAALDHLATPATPASIGFFTVTLTWDGTGDVDLHVTEPSGSHVFYDSKTGISGSLDVDNIVGFGPEHYFANCDASHLPGIYHVGINNYARATGRRATVQVASMRNGVLETETLDVGPERGADGNNSPIPVLTIKVGPGADGNYTVASASVNPPAPVPTPVPTPTP